MNNITMGISLSITMRKTLMIIFFSDPSLPSTLTRSQQPSMQPDANLTSCDKNGEMNALILDYLTVSGYSRAAASFAAEANLNCQQDSESMQLRQGIQNAIHDGKVHEAIQALNDMDPEVNQLPTSLPSLTAFTG